MVPLNLIYVTACKAEPMIKLIEFSKNQICRICKLLGNFFIYDHSNFRCSKFYQLCTLQYCDTKSKTAALWYSSAAASEGKINI